MSYLQARAEGNALFVGELLRALEEGGSLARAGDAWRLGDLGQAAVPPLLRQVIDLRVARLNAEAQRLLAVAAVIGQEVPLAVLAAVGAADEGTLLDLAERAEEAHVLVGTPDGAGVRFAHALVREALYEGIVPLRRARIHRQVADALLARPAPDPDVLVYHLRRADDARRGHWLVEAGERAYRAFAWETAIARYEEALQLLVTPEDAPERHRVLMHLWDMRLYEPAAVAYAEEAVRVAEEMGDASLAAFTRARLGFARAANGDIATGLAEQERALAVLATHPDFAAHDISVTTADHVRGNLAAALAVVGRLREAHTSAIDGARSSNDYYALASCAGMLGEPEAALAEMEALRAISPPGDSRRAGLAHSFDLVCTLVPYYADDARRVREVAAAAAAAAYAEVGEAVLGFPPAAPVVAPLLLHGRWDEAMAYLPVARRLRHSAVAEIAAFPLFGAVVRARGERELGREMVREMFPAGPGTEPGAVPLRYALAMQRLGAGLALDDGNLDAAKAWLGAHDRWLAWSGAVLGLSEGQALWAEYHRQTGDRGKARSHAERALAHATDPRQPLALLAAHRLLGELETEAGQYEDAARHLDASLRLAEACEAPYERALTLLALAGLRVARGETEDAHRLLDEVRSVCTPLGAMPALARADDLQARLTATPTAALAYPAGLAAREVEVLRLVAQGLTNGQVAERLYLSPRTVEQHLRSIYNKLSVSTRAAATRFAIEHDLA